jgi:phage gp45-like
MINIYNKIKSLIKTGVGISTDDSNPIQTAKASWLGRSSQKIEVHVPYGTFGSPVEGVQYILLNKRGNESNVVGIPSDSINRIKKNTSPGEFGIGNALTGSNIYFKENGSAALDADSIELNGDSKSFVTHAELNTALQTFVTALNANFATKLDGGGTTGVLTLDISSSATTTVKTGG